MTAYKITYKHSGMLPEYVGTAYKHANSVEEAVGKMSKSGTATKSNTIIDKQRNTITILDITTETTAII